MRRQRWTVDDLDTWYREHSGWLRKVAARLLGDASLAEDVVHEAFIRAWIARDRLASDEHVGPWLHRTTRNLCIDTHRRDARRLASSVVELAGSCDPAVDVEAHLAWTDIVACLRSLNEHQRRALMLRTEGMSYAELADELGITAVGARAVVNRARQALRLRLQEAGHSVASVVLWMQHRGRTSHTAEAVGAGAIAVATTIASIVGGSSNVPAARPAPDAPRPAIVAQAPAATAVPVAKDAPATTTSRDGPDVPAREQRSREQAPDAAASPGPNGDAAISLRLAARSGPPELHVPLPVNLVSVSLGPLLTLRFGP